MTTETTDPLVDASLNDDVLQRDLAAARADAARLRAALEQLDRHFNGHMGWVSGMGQEYWDALIRVPKEIARAALEPSQ